MKGSPVLNALPRAKGALQVSQVPACDLPRQVQRCDRIVNGLGHGLALFDRGLYFEVASSRTRRSVESSDRVNGVD